MLSQQAPSIAAALSAHLPATWAAATSLAAVGALAALPPCRRSLLLPACPLLHTMHCSHLPLQRWMATGTVAGRRSPVPEVDVLPPYASNVRVCGPACAVAVAGGTIGVRPAECFGNGSVFVSALPTATLAAAAMALLQPKYERVQAAKAEALQGGGPERVEKQHAKVGGKGGVARCSWNVRCVQERLYQPFPAQRFNCPVGHLLLQGKLTARERLQVCCNLEGVEQCSLVACSCSSLCTVSMDHQPIPSHLCPCAGAV